MAKLPIIGSTGSAIDLAYSLAQVPCTKVNARFKARLAVLLDAAVVHTLNSGIASFYQVLEVLKTVSAKKEVILPAYTAGSLVVAIKKAGLKPVLCDISLDDFNAGMEEARSSLSDNTLAVVAVHMFGIPLSGIETLKSGIAGNVFLVEDCCQAMGSRIKDKPVGVFGDISFFSFNRGKNLPANNGGCIITRNSFLEEPLLRAMSECPQPDKMEWLRAFLKTVIFMIGTNPPAYGVGHWLAAGFRETAPPDDFSVRRMGNFQAAFGLCSLPKAETLFMSRYRNGIALLQGLKGTSGVRLPQVALDTRPVFNRMPVIFEKPGLVQLAQNKLWQKGIETSRMYLKPLHHMFDLGYERGDFPKARYLADHLLTLPVHPGVRGQHIKTMIDTIRGLP